MTDSVAPTVGSVVGTTPPREQQQQEVDKNYEAFLKMRFEREQIGMFALLRHGELVEFLENRRDALKMGTHLYEDGIFSIQEVGAQPARLGFMTYVLCAD